MPFAQVSETGPLSVNRFLNFNMRPFLSRRILITCTSLFVFTLLFHHAYYLNDNEVSLCRCRSACEDSEY